MYTLEKETLDEKEFKALIGEGISIVV